MRVCICVYCGLLGAVATQLRTIREIITSLKVGQCQISLTCRRTTHTYTHIHTLTPAHSNPQIHTDNNSLATSEIICSIDIGHVLLFFFFCMPTVGLITVRTALTIHRIKLLGLKDLLI